MFENIGFKTKIGGSRYKNFGPNMCHTLRSLVSRSVILFFFLELKLFIVNSNRKQRFQVLRKPPSWIGAENEHSYPVKEGPMLKPSFSKLGTCEGWNSLLWLTKLHFETGVFERVAPPHELSSNKRIEGGFK